MKTKLRHNTSGANSDEEKKEGRAIFCRWDGADHMREARGSDCAAYLLHFKKIGKNGCEMQKTLINVYNVMLHLQFLHRTVKPAPLSIVHPHEQHILYFIYGG